MDVKEALEIVITSGVADEIKDAVNYLTQLEVDNVQLQNRCRALTSGVLCRYCGMYDRCGNKEVNDEISN